MHNYYFPPAPSSTPWAPPGHRDGKSIAVAMSGSIWRVDPETGIADELTSGPGTTRSPPGLPTGDTSSSRWTETARPSASRSRTWPPGKSVLSRTMSSFTPIRRSRRTGTRLAYVSTKPSGYFNVYVREFANGELGSEEMALTRDENYGKERLYFGSWDMHITPAWMPDSRELLMVSNHEVPLGSGNVIRTPMAVDGFEEGVTVLAEQSLYRSRPDVSIDGKRFIYSSTAGAADQFSNLYVQPTDGGSPYKLTFFEHDGFHPRWSPNGEWIAYVDNSGDSRSSRCSRPTAASGASWRSPGATGADRWGCSRCVRWMTRPARRSLPGFTCGPPTPGSTPRRTPTPGSGAPMSTPSTSQAVSGWKSRWDPSRSRRCAASSTNP